MVSTGVRREKLRQSFNKLRPVWLTRNRADSSSSTCTDVSEADDSNAESDLDLSPFSTQSSFTSIDEDFVDKKPLAADQNGFRFLDLPLELKQVVFKHYFNSQEKTLKIKRRNVESKEVVHNHWNPHLHLLLACREIYLTAKPFLNHTEPTLDLRQYATDEKRTLDIESIINTIPDLQKSVTQLIVSSDQIWKTLDPSILSRLKLITVWDYTSWRQIVFNAGPVKLGTSFEKQTCKILHPVAQDDLREMKEYFPSTAKREVVYVCDCLVCLEEDVWRPRQDKIRHVVKFDTEQYQNGTILAKDWVTSRTFGGPLPLHSQIAPHVHEICTHLIDHGL